MPDIVKKNVGRHCNDSFSSIKHLSVRVTQSKSRHNNERNDHYNKSDYILRNMV